MSESATFRGLNNILYKNSFLKAGIIIISFFIGVILVTFVYLPSNPYASVGPDFAPPSYSFPFGTTNIGQNILSQWMVGTGSTLSVGLIAAVVSMVFGVMFGISAAFVKHMDEPLMRSADVILTLPTLPLMIVLAAFLKPTEDLIAIIIGILSWPATARVIRSTSLSIKSQPYIEVALMSGVPKRAIMFKDVFFHTLPIALTYSIFSIIGAILTIASLNFLGLGNLSYITWGSMIALANDSSAIYLGAWWWIIIPGLSIILLSTGFAFIAYGLETKWRSI